MEEAFGAGQAHDSPVICKKPGLIMVTLAKNSAFYILRETMNYHGTNQGPYSH